MATMFLTRLVLILAMYAKAVWYGFVVSLNLTYQQLCKPYKRLWVPKRRSEPPKCLREESLGQHNYVRANGLKFHYVEKGDRSKPLMLFVHGFPEFWYSWRYQMAEFSSDYWTVSFDMRGYGDSDKPVNVSAYKKDCMVEDIKALVTELGRKTFTLVGHDWGAVVSWHFLETYPSMVDKYVIMNGPHPAVFKALLLKSPRQLKMSWYMFFYQLPWLPELWSRWDDFALISGALLGGKSKNSPMTQDDVEAFKYTFSKGSTSGPINYYRAISTKPATINKDIRWPQGLYIFGDNDRFIDVSCVPLIEKMIPNVKTSIIKGANHFVQQDDPKAVNSAMRSFL